MKAVLVINAQHRLFPEQENLLGEAFNSVEELRVPAEGWDRDTQLAVAAELARKDEAIVFASPVPLLLGRVAASRGGRNTYVFHNDRREKKELPNGRVISVVAQTGWELLPLTDN